MVLTESMVVTHGSLQRAPGRCALTIGNFDGVHRGHRALIERVCAKARELELTSCVLTFEPHPREFFDPQAAPARLTRLRDKLELIDAVGVERVHVARFDRRFASLPAQRFVEEVLVKGLATRWLLVGRDFRFGARRAGDFGALAAEGGRHDFEVESMADVVFDGARVSSSAVRAALAAGDIASAERLLGHPYTISGRGGGARGTPRPPPRLPPPQPRPASAAAARRHFRGGGRRSWSGCGEHRQASHRETGAAAALGGASLRLGARPVRRAPACALPEEAARRAEVRWTRRPEGGHRARRAAGP